MRIDRPILFLTILAVAAACSSTGDAAAVPADATPAAVAAAPAPAPVVVEQVPGPTVNVRWDSAPLDRDYRLQRSNLDAQHARERAHPVAGVSVDILSRRQADESKALEVRYTRGKTDHARGMPPQ
jgi:hypothetical protein